MGNNHGKHRQDVAFVISYIKDDDMSYLGLPEIM